ncbi:MAG: N-6 DNA methylase, partial [Lamprobacter sp.]|uniref:N-6 DNA methylase n=1 Tax=Lamprobacter sp. TaxID=3100796 RepID=UPI002B262EA3
ARGRAGFVMSSQASSAGGGEAALRQKLVETGDVDLMIAIRSNFFYTRTVPCELWFLNRAKPEAHRDKVLMLDARNIYRKVTRKIYDFSPEQQQNLLAIVWLYRGENERFLDLISDYLAQVLEAAEACCEQETEDELLPGTVPGYLDAVAELVESLRPFLDTLALDGPHADTLAELDKAMDTFADDLEDFEDSVADATAKAGRLPDPSDGLSTLTEQLAPLAETSRNLVKQSDLLYKLATRLIETCEKACNAKDSNVWNSRDITRARKAADAARQEAVEQLKQVRYFWRQAHWLVERFPEA